MSRLGTPPFGAGMGRDGVGVGWVPSDAGVWLPADRLAAGPVTSFADASGNVAPFTQPGGAGQRPIATTTGSPNPPLNVLNFTGSSGQSLWVPAQALGQYNYTLYALVQSPISSTEQVWFQNGGFSSGTEFGTAGNVQREIKQVAATAMLTSYPSNGWEVWVVTCTAAHLYTLTINGRSVTLTPNNATSFAPAAAMGLGGGEEGGDLFWTGNFAEMFFYPGVVHSAGQISQRVNYLVRKWRQNLPQLIWEGNSLVSGVGASGPTTTLPAQVHALLGGRYTTYNNGVSGIDTPTMTTYSPISSDPLFSVYRPQNISIGWELTNDSYLHDTAPAMLLSNYWTWAAQVVAAGRIPVAVTYMSRSGGTTPADFDANRATVNAGVRAGYIANGCKALIDIGGDSILGVNNAPTVNPTYYVDTTHCNDLGYSRCASITVAALRSAGLLMQ